MAAHRREALQRFAQQRSRVVSGFEVAHRVAYLVGVVAEAGPDASRTSATTDGLGMLGRRALQRT